MVKKVLCIKPNTHRRRRRDETVEFRRVGGVYMNSQLVGECFVVSSVWTHPSAVVTQFTISCADKWRHNDVIVLKVIKIHKYYTTRLIRMFTNMQRHMLRHIVLLCHWLQNCKLGHGRRLRCAFASPNPSTVVADSCTHRRRRRDETRHSTVRSRRRRQCVLGFRRINNLQNGQVGSGPVPYAT